MLTEPALRLEDSVHPVVPNSKSGLTISPVTGVAVGGATNVSVGAAVGVWVCVGVRVRVAVRVGDGVLVAVAVRDGVNVIVGNKIAPTGACSLYNAAIVVASIRPDAMTSSSTSTMLFARLFEPTSHAE